MPIKIDGRRFDRSSDRRTSPLSSATQRHGTASNPLQIALINNMPDAAMEDTELQYLDLLGAAAESTSIRLKLFSLPNIPRGERARQHLADCYSGLEDLFNNRFDAAIITGTEPKQRDLRQEPYWHELTEVMEWAERNTTSTVLSCLAAHAGVLLSDGIDRQLLADKRFGVFRHAKTCDHALLQNLPDSVHMPHSRWNEIRETDLAACGYTVLTRSSEAGVDLFVKQKRSSLFMHFQGHPEYQEQTLSKEYRRDVKRFLRGERDTYPILPVSYFDSQTEDLLAKFQESAMNDCREDRASEIPAAVEKPAQCAWRGPATGIYKNWIQMLACRQAVARVIAVPVRTETQLWRRSAKAV
jgi:homoserine O-succinyltransferase/O-acetyltransferase